MTQPQPTRIGDFHLVRKLGEGGMGAVYEARQAVLDRTVALKLLSPRLARDEAFVARFLREARATAALNHPHIVAGIDVSFADGHYYFAMEFVAGETLRARIKREGALEEKEVARVGAAIASALAHAHQAGIVHRDVKPENILLGPDGAPKLADLGLAKAAAGTEDGSLTQSGTTVGTPHYIAPEQARGEKDIDGRADLYALGCTLYHAATGKTPFEAGATALLMVKHLQERMPHPQAHRPELSDAFCAVLSRMVARDPKHRYQDAQQAAADLAALAAGQGPAVKPLPPNLSNFLSAAKAVGSTVLSARGERRSSGRLAPVAATARRATTAKAREASKGWMPWAGALGSVALLAVFLSVMLGGSAEPPRRKAEDIRPPPSPDPREPLSAPAAPAHPTPPAANLSPAVPAEDPVPHTPSAQPGMPTPADALAYRFDTQDAFKRFEGDFEFYRGGSFVLMRTGDHAVREGWAGERRFEEGTFRLQFRPIEEVQCRYGHAPHDFQHKHRTWKGDWELGLRVKIPPPGAVVRNTFVYLYFHQAIEKFVRTCGASVHHSGHYKRYFAGTVVDRPDFGYMHVKVGVQRGRELFREHGAMAYRWTRRGASLSFSIDGKEAYSAELPAHVTGKMDGYPLRLGFFVNPPQESWIVLESLYFGPPRSEAP